MRDALPVRLGNGGTGLAKDGERLVHWQRPLLQTLPEITALSQLGGHEPAPLRRDP